MDPAEPRRSSSTSSRSVICWLPRPAASRSGPVSVACRSGSRLGREWTPAGVRAAALALAGDVALVRNVAAIVQGGNALELTRASRATAARSLPIRFAYELSMVVEAASIEVPALALRLSGASGEVRIAQRVLSAQAVAATIGRSSLRDGKLVLALEPTVALRELSASLDVDLAENRGLAVRLSGSPDARYEWSRIESIEGRAKGTLALREAGGGFRQTLDVASLTARMRHADVPLPIVIDTGGLRYESGGALALRGLAGAIGASRVERLDAEPCAGRATGSPLGGGDRGAGAGRAVPLARQAARSPGRCATSFRHWTEPSGVTLTRLAGPLRAPERLDVAAVLDPAAGACARAATRPSRWRSPRERSGWTSANLGFDGLRVALQDARGTVSGSLRAYASSARVLDGVGRARNDGSTQCRMGRGRGGMGSRCAGAGTRHDRARPPPVARGGAVAVRGRRRGRAFGPARAPRPTSAGVRAACRCADSRSTIRTATPASRSTGSGSAPGSRSRASFGALARAHAGGAARRLGHVARRIRRQHRLPEPDPLARDGQARRRRCRALRRYSTCRSCSIASRSRPTATVSSCSDTVLRVAGDRLTVAGRLARAGDGFDRRRRRRRGCRRRRADSRDVARHATAPTAGASPWGWPLRGRVALRAGRVDGFGYRMEPVVADPGAGRAQGHRERHRGAPLRDLRAVHAVGDAGHPGRDGTRDGARPGTRLVGLLPHEGRVPRVRHGGFQRGLRGPRSTRVPARLGAGQRKIACTRRSSRGHACDLRRSVARQGARGHRRRGIQRGPRRIAVRRHRGRREPRGRALVDRPRPAGKTSAQRRLSGRHPARRSGRSR